MDAWVIRKEREGEPTDAFQIEQMEVPEPGAMEVIVRVMAAGVNYNNVWAALGEPVSVFRYHAEDHHIGGSDASGIVERVGPGVTAWKPGDEVVLHCNQASYEDVEVHGLDPLAAPSQRIWGYETTWGSFAQFCKVQAQQCLPKPEHLSWEEAASYALTYFTAYRMLIDQARIQAGHRVLVWGAAGGLGVFALQLCRLMGADTVALVSSPGKAELCRQLGATHVVDRRRLLTARASRKGRSHLGGYAEPDRAARPGRARHRHQVQQDRDGRAPGRLVRSAPRGRRLEVRLVGVVTLSDIMKVPVAERGRATVAEVMGGRDGLHTVAAGGRVQEVVELLAQHDLEQVPIVDGSRYIGMLTRGDVLRQLQLREALDVDK
jgi:crotonyl-CoA carboxylase/reductase